MFEMKLAVNFRLFDLSK